MSAIADWSWRNAWAESWLTIGKAHADSIIGRDSHERCLDAHRLERNGWARGQWDDESDRVEWRHAGFQCVMLRATGTGAWCGYIGIPRSHPWFALGYSELDVNVHGGLTYAGYCNDVLCADPEDGEDAHAWFIGFDCSHYRDIAPGLDASSEHIGIGPRSSYEDRYCYEQYVVGEVNCLAEQAAIARAVATFTAADLHDGIERVLGVKH